MKLKALRRNEVNGMEDECEGDDEEELDEEMQSDSGSEDEEMSEVKIRFVLFHRYCGISIKVWSINNNSFAV